MQYVIGSCSWHDIVVCLSVCLSVTLCIMALMQGRRVPSRQLELPNISSHIFAVGYIVYPQVLWDVLFSHNKTQRRTEPLTFPRLE